MGGYIDGVLTKYGHPAPKKQQLSPHKHRPINYGTKQQMSHTEDDSPALDDKGVKRIQGIVGALLYVGRAVNNKLLVALSAIGVQQEKTTEETAAAIEQLIDYVATYPNDGILFLASNMILAAHSDAGFLNESKARRRSGAFIFISENEQNPKLNGPILTIPQIIKSVIASAGEAELAALYITAKTMVPLRNTLIEM